MQKAAFASSIRYIHALQFTPGTLRLQHPADEPESIMKTSSLLKSITVATFLGAALSAVVLAQMGPGPGAGRSMGAGPGQMSGPKSGMPGKGAAQMGQTNTPGWSLMTPEERTATQSRMREVKTYEECVQVQDEHRTQMTTRAAEKGITLNTPQQNYCDVAKARGQFN